MKVIIVTAFSRDSTISVGELEKLEYLLEVKTMTEGWTSQKILPILINQLILAVKLIK